MITLENDLLTLTVDPLGAQMMSLKAGGVEYLWQGDPKYWADRAPTLFPFVGRLWSNQYQFQGKPYALGIHGFAAASKFTPEEQGREHLVLALHSDESTKVQYPFEFCLRIGFLLKGNTVEITYEVLNEDRKVMPFGIGGHPGFRVPLKPQEQFEDYYLEFTTACQPDRVGFTPELYLSGRDERYPLESGKRLPLHHELFDEDAIVWKNMGKEITLRSKTGKHAVMVSYPQMNYLGVWHWPKTDAPYVCIEPWSSLPGRQNVIEEFSCKSDLIHLLPGKTYRNTWSITIKEGIE